MLRLEGGGGAWKGRGCMLSVVVNEWLAKLIVFVGAWVVKMGMGGTEVYLFDAQH
jgi:hypothetical protein